MTYHEEGKGYEEGDHETQVVGGRGWAEAVMAYPLGTQSFTTDP